MRRHICQNIVLLLVALPWLLESPKALGQSFSEIVEQAPQVRSIGSEANRLVSKLDLEVRKIVAAGHLMPFRAQYGENGNRYTLNGADHAYDEPWMMMLTLARAYPYLSPSRQTEVRQYLQTESVAYPPWADQPLGALGAYRQGDLPGVPETGLPNNDYRRRGTLFYALWLYGHQSKDWSIIENQWSNIKNIYAQVKNGPKTYELTNGAIAMWRLAVHFSEPAATLSQYENEAVGFLNDGLNYPTFRAAAIQDYAQKSDWERGTYGIPYPLFHLTPEVGRAISANTALKDSIEADIEPAPTGQNNGWVLPYAAAIEYPFWWMAQGPSGDGGYFGEGCSIGPHMRMALYPYMAWVRALDSGRLVYLLDVPDALVGDCYYLQNLVTAIESFGATSWQSLLQPDGNRRPQAVIASPTDRSSFQVGDAVSFSGSATDTEDGSIPSSMLMWASQIDGPLGTGATLSVSTLSIGRHAISLQATDTAGLSGWDAVLVDIQGVSGQAPDAPTNLQATAGNGSVQLVWVASAQALAYRLYRADKSGGPYTRVGQTTAAELAYSDTGLQNGVTYYYVATALAQGAMESPYSNEAVATPQGSADGGTQEDGSTEAENDVPGSDSGDLSDSGPDDEAPASVDTGPDSQGNGEVVGGCGCSTRMSPVLDPSVGFAWLGALCCLLFLRLVAVRKLTHTKLDPAGANLLQNPSRQVALGANPDYHRQTKASLITRWVLEP